jgi:hypothetical protein
MDEFARDALKVNERPGNDFSFWVPMSIAKSASAAEKKRIIQGIASTEDVDAQGESVLQQGIDFGPLLKDGFINSDHAAGFENLIGQPLEAHITNVAGKPALFVKGVLFDGVPRADAAWALLNSLEKGRAEGTTTRRLGWSVEGAVLERRGNLIAKSVVRHVALTHQPVAYGTFADLAKSLVKAQAVAASSVATSSPLLLQNLAGGRKSAREVCLALFGENSSKCAEIHKGFKKSRVDFVDHLVLCMGWPTDGARTFVTAMSGLLG